MTRTIAATDPEAVVEASHVLDERELVVFPTDTLYGIAADALDEEACLRVFDAKGRPPDSPLPVLVASVADIHHVARLTPLARRLAARHLPGPLTLVLPALEHVPTVVTAGGGTVAVRVVAQPFAQALAAHFGPVTATSANIHGAPSPATCDAAREQLGSRAQLYVDAGMLAGVASTIVDATGDEPKVLRVGAVAAASLDR